MVTVSAYSDPVTLQMAPGVWRFYAMPFAFLDGTYGLLEYNEVYDYDLRAPYLASLNLNLLDTINGQPTTEIPVQLTGNHLVAVLMQMPGGRFLQSGFVSATSTEPSQSFFQFLTPEGAPDGHRLIIDAPAGTGVGGIEAAALLPQGGFVATWSQYDGSPGQDGWDVAIQIFSANGQPKSQVLSLGSSGDQSAPDVAVLSPTRIVQTWLDTSSGWAVRAQVFDATGAAIGTVATVASSLDGYASHNKVVALAKGGFAAFWAVEKFDSDGNQTSYQMRVLSATGSAVSGVVTVDFFNAGPNTQGFLSAPEIIALQDGRIAVAWTEHVAAAPNDAGRAFYSTYLLRVFEANGTMASPLYTLSQSDGLQSGTGIVALADGRIAATWMQMNPVTWQMEQVTQILDPRDRGINLTGSVLGDQNAGSLHDDTLRGGLGDDSLFGNAGNDRLDGGIGNDLLLGGTGWDVLIGGAGNDVLTGFDGSDRINGGFGNDLIFGGRGRDVFIFAPGDGADRIRGFVDGQDRIDLSAYDLGGASAVLRHFAATAGGVEFTDGTDSVLILGLTMGQLSGADLILI